MRIRTHRVLLVAALTLAASTAFADRRTFEPPTAWGHPQAGAETSVRGLAYDGQFYYVADCNDYAIDGRPRDNTGRVYIYDAQGRFVKRIPEQPPVRGQFFPHGAATDGARLWTSGYFDPHLYEYDIATGALLRTIASPFSQVIRLDYQRESRTLLLTVYGDHHAYVVDLDGQVRGRVAMGTVSPNADAKTDGRGTLWIDDTGLAGGQDVLHRISRSGVPLQAYGTGGWSSLATDVNARDKGYVIDLAPTQDAQTGRWAVHFQQVRVATVGGSDDGLQAGAAVSCLNATTGHRVDAFQATPGRWNCEDAGLAVNTGDVVQVQVGGAAR